MAMLNVIALMVHESFAGGMPTKANGKYFVWDKCNHGLYTEVSEGTYRRLNLHESSVLWTAIIGGVSFAGLLRLTENSARKK